MLTPIVDLLIKWTGHGQNHPDVGRRIFDMESDEYVVVTQVIHNNHWYYTRPSDKNYYLTRRGIHPLQGLINKNTMNRRKRIENES